jgi:ATP-binding cassette subfamily F protein uup
MNVLSVDNLSKSFTDKKLINQITFGLSKGEKIAIVGRNGAGKSTLLKIIGNTEIPDSGVVAVHKSCTLGYLEQEPKLSPGKSILEITLESRPDIAAAVSLYDKAINGGQLELMDEAISAMDTLQAWEFEDKAKRILHRLGLTDLSADPLKLSGGQQRRIALARILLQEPDVMLLDEPTNHLDLDMIEWLEFTLKSSTQTILFITHDRYFLDAIATGILELDRGNVQFHQGTYADYLEKKAIEEEIRAASLGKVQNTLRKEVDWIRRQPKARGTKAKYRVDAFYEMEDKAQDLKNTGQGNVQLEFQSKRLGNKILELNHVSKAFGEKTILNDFSYTFRRLEKLGIIGKNGSGKTTLLQMITNKINADSGEITKGETIHIGYYTQKGLQYKPGQKVIEVLTDIAEQFTGKGNENISASRLLTQFLFEPSRQYELVEKLSGGEKKRLHLLTILVTQPNFLILDEPTNDLDLSTLSVLEDFLTSYQGCLIIVSHDRYFMDQMVDHLLVFEGDGVVREYPGNYTDYRNQLEEDKINSRNPEKEIKAVVEPVKTEETKPAATKTKLSYKEQQELAKIETELAALESEKNTLVNSLSSGLSNEQMLATSKNIEAIDAKIEAITMRWLELEERKG